MYNKSQNNIRSEHYKAHLMLPSLHCTKDYIQLCITFFLYMKHRMFLLKHTRMNECSLLIKHTRMNECSLLIKHTRMNECSLLIKHTRMNECSLLINKIYVHLLSSTISKWKLLLM